MAIDSGEMETPQVYDPLLGKERDAFPGEIIPPEQENTLSRLMAQGEGEFKALYDAVAGTGQLSDDELNVILKAGKIRAEQKREEYLKSIRSNPANLIGAIIQKLQDGNSGQILRAKQQLNKNVTRVTDLVTVAKGRDVAIGQKPKKTLDYTSGSVANEQSRTLTFLSIIPGESLSYAKREKQISQLLTELDGYPTPEPSTFQQLASILPPAPQGIEYKDDYNVAYKKSIQNPNIGRFERLVLPSKKPGLEGIQLLVDIQTRGSGEYFSLGSTIVANPSAWARIIDTGGFAPLMF